MLKQQTLHQQNGTYQHFAQDLEQEIDSKTTKKVKDPKFLLFLRTAFFLFCLYLFIKDYVVNADWQSYTVPDKLVLSGIILFFTILILNSFIKFFRSWVLFELSLKGLEFRNGVILWQDVQQIYFYGVVVGEYVDEQKYTLVIAHTEGVKSIATEFYKSDVDDALNEIGKFRWNWRKANDIFVKNDEVEASAG
ncbi:MAG: hypothetical protein AAFQ94_22585 [Bacteroidota bacterium]